MGFWYLFGSMIYRWEHYKQKALKSFYQRYYSGKIEKKGAGCYFNGPMKIRGTDQVSLGKNVHIGEGAYIRAEGGLEIEDNVHIARNLTVYTHSHNYQGRALPYDDEFMYKKVLIQRNVWIGINVIILPGTEIGEGAVIGSGAVVHGKIPDLAIIGAAAGQILKTRDKEHYQKLEQNQQYGGQNGKPLFE
ncbi:MAG: acyltransferase [Bacteroidales bacterium]|nr:acyltransferase [Bacteroidales bacterium]